MATPTKTVSLRGYIKEAAPNRFVGVCLTLNLVVEGQTQTEAIRKLLDVIQVYVDDAVQNNELEHFVPRRAPTSFYVEYWGFRAVGWMHAVKTPFFAFRESRRIPLHA